jgi:hypothetical protein
MVDFVMTDAISYEWVLAECMPGYWAAFTATLILCKGFSEFDTYACKYSGESFIETAF